MIDSYEVLCVLKSILYFLEEADAVYQLEIYGSVLKQINDLILKAELDLKKGDKMIIGKSYVEENCNMGIECPKCKFNNNCYSQDGNELVRLLESVKQRLEMLDGLFAKHTPSETDTSGFISNHMWISNIDKFLYKLKFGKEKLLDKKD
ncbi:MAG: hypothetical protein WC783_00065 [Candidatus Paceibacterota bacterium]|jgi:hypothetical protein